MLFLLTTQQIAKAQSPLGEEERQPRVALRTNLLYDATLTPNLGMDVRVDSAWTVGLLVGINAWDIDKEKNKKWRHALFSIRARKYRDSLFHKGYYEADVIYSHYNVGNTKIPFGLYSAVKDRRAPVGQGCRLLRKGRSLQVAEHLESIVLGDAGELLAVVAERHAGCASAELGCQVFNSLLAPSAQRPEDTVTPFQSALHCSTPPFSR